MNKKLKTMRTINLRTIFETDLRKVLRSYKEAYILSNN